LYIGQIQDEGGLGKHADQQISGKFGDLKVMGREAVITGVIGDRSLGNYEWKRLVEVLSLREHDGSDK
jgi:hypothetical protein